MSDSSIETPSSRPFHTLLQFISIFCSGRCISLTSLQQLPLGAPCRLRSRIAVTVNRSEDGNVGFARTVASAQGIELELDGALLPSVIDAVVQLCGDSSSVKV